MNPIKAAPVALLAVALAFGATACNDDSPNQSAGSGTTELADATTEAPEATDAGTTEPSAGTDAPGATDTPETPEPGDEPTVESATAVLVRLTEEEATAAAEELDWEVRVIRRDGEDLPMTMDLRPNRVNVEVTDGDVTSVLHTG